MATFQEAVAQLEADMEAQRAVAEGELATFEALHKALMLASVMPDVSATGRQILRDLLGVYPAPLLQADYNRASLAALARRDMIVAVGELEFEFSAAAKELVDRMEA